MKIAIESTDKVVTLNGIECRIWEGFTESGIPMHAYIPRVAVQEGLDCSQFEVELQEKRKPSFAVEAIPLRMIL